jgi:signal transduction histidine kinase
MIERMENTQSCPLAAELAARMRDARDELTKRWLERIAARVRLEPEHVFEASDLVDHVPLLVVGIADYIEDPMEEITADLPVLEKAMEIGELRFAQGFDASEILKEYEILGGVLFAFAAHVAAASQRPCTSDELMACGHRLFRALSVIEQATTANYLRVLGEKVGEREERLRRFNRMITHELKNRVGATLGAAELLGESWLGDAERRRFTNMITENATAVQRVLDDLSILTRLDAERRARNVMLPEAVAEVFRQLRQLARARRVELRVAGTMPEVQVNAAAVELSLSNYLSNAIKYSDPGRPMRWAEVEAHVEQRNGIAELIVRVRDNGLGVPQSKRGRLFERFYRAHAENKALEGTGLGLSLVRETIESLGGRAWAEFDVEPGSIFAFGLPYDTRGSSPFKRANERLIDRPSRPTDAAPATASD